MWTKGLCFWTRYDRETTIKLRPSKLMGWPAVHFVSVADVCCCCLVLSHVQLFDTTRTAARLSWPSLFPEFQTRIPNKSLQEMELNSVPLECGLDSATNEWQIWYMTLMRLGYKKMVNSALNSLALSHWGEASCPGFEAAPLWGPCGAALKLLVNSQRGTESANNPSLELGSTNPSS